MGHSTVDRLGVLGAYQKELLLGQHQVASFQSVSKIYALSNTILTELDVPKVKVPIGFKIWIEMWANGIKISAKVLIPNSCPHGGFWWERKITLWKQSKKFLDPVGENFLVQTLEKPEWSMFRKSHPLTIV